MNLPFFTEQTSAPQAGLQTAQHLAAVKTAEAAGPVAMLDLALKLGEEELKALTDGEVDAATGCCELRARLLSGASKVQIGENKAAVVARLRAMGYLQVRLTKAGQELRAQMAAKINRSKAESRRLRGYRQSVGYSLTSA